MASKGGGGGGRERCASEKKMSSSSGGSSREATILGRDKVWLADGSGVEGFLLGRIVELAEEGPVVQPITAVAGSGKYEAVGPPIQAAYESVYPAEEDDTKEVEDNCGLMYLNEATLLRNVGLRYAKDKIYTYVANILVAVNPYYEVGGLYSAQTIRSYMGRSLGTRPPHVYAIADKVRKYSYLL
jgi:myosin-6